MPNADVTNHQCVATLPSPCVSCEPCELYCGLYPPLITILSWVPTELLYYHHGLLRQYRYRASKFTTPFASAGWGDRPILSPDVHTIVNNLNSVAQTWRGNAYARAILRLCVLATTASLGNAFSPIWWKWFFTTKQIHVGGESCAPSSGGTLAFLKD